MGFPTHLCTFKCDLAVLLKWLLCSQISKGNFPSLLHLPSIFSVWLESTLLGVEMILKGQLRRIANHWVSSHYSAAGKFGSFHSSELNRNFVKRKTQMPILLQVLIHSK